MHIQKGARMGELTKKKMWRHSTILLLSKCLEFYLDLFEEIQLEFTHLITIYMQARQFRI